MIKRKTFFIKILTDQGKFPLESKGSFSGNPELNPVLKPELNPVLNPELNAELFF